MVLSQGAQTSRRNSCFTVCRGERELEGRNANGVQRHRAIGPGSPSPEVHQSRGGASSEQGEQLPGSANASCRTLKLGHLAWLLLLNS